MRVSSGSQLKYIIAIWEGHSKWELFGRMLSLNQISSGGMEGRKTGEEQPRGRKELLDYLPEREF